MTLVDSKTNTFQCVFVPNSTHDSVIPSIKYIAIPRGNSFTDELKTYKCFFDK